MTHHLEMPDAESSQCAFCDYLAGRRPYPIVRRTRRTVVMVTREPRGVPHLLVATIQHRPTLLDLDDGEAGEILRATREVARAIDTAFKRPGISVWQNNGVPAHQAIPHFHMHVAGTLNGGGTDWGTVPERSIAEAQRVANQIDAVLRDWN